MFRKEQMSSVNEKNLGVGFIVFFFVLFVILIPFGAIHAVATVYPPGSKPYDLTHGQWSEKWWQWALSIPTDKDRKSHV